MTLAGSNGSPAHTSWQTASADPDPVWLCAGLLLVAGLAPVPASCEPYRFLLHSVLPKSTRSWWKDTWQLVACIETVHGGTTVAHSPWTRSFGNRAHSNTLKPDHFVNANYNFDLFVPTDKVIVRWALVRTFSSLAAKFHENIRSPCAASVAGAPGQCSQVRRPRSMFPSWFVSLTARVHVFNTAAAGASLLCEVLNALLSRYTMWWPQHCHYVAH